MACCNHCRDAEGFFGARRARLELRKYRKRGLSSSTARLLDALREAGVQGATLLDVGGGVGAIQHELFREGLARAIQVDASRAYLEVAEKAAADEGNRTRSTFHFGDFVELAPGLPEADFVTLDRVLCCYPHMDRLLEAAMGRTRKVLGLVYPRERRGTRLAITLGNLWFRLRGSDFRIFLHPPAGAHKLLEAAGFRPIHDSRTFVWRVEVWERGADAGVGWNRRPSSPPER
ncbi:MAG: methyltransferase domain-containing protein [Gemmatimonadota bacterium]